MALASFMSPFTILSPVAYLWIQLSKSLHLGIGLSQDIARSSGPNVTLTHIHGMYGLPLEMISMTRN